MEHMDRARRLGGWLWVGSGIAFQLLTTLAGWERPGPITMVLMFDIIVLAMVLALYGNGLLTLVIGWLTAVLLAADLGGAVLDRFGVFGEPDAAGVSWGSWENFVDYTGVLLHHPGDTLITLAAIGATLVEIVLAILLLSGWQRRWVGKATAGLLVIYLIALAASSEREGVSMYAMPILVGGALLLSATPARRRHPGPNESNEPDRTRGFSSVLAR